MARAKVATETILAASRRLAMDRRLTEAQARALAADAAQVIQPPPGRDVHAGDLCELAAKWYYRPR